MQLTRSWFPSSQIQEKHKSLPVRQIYLWFITEDLKIVIVGRDLKWQFPGGKPEEGEGIIETLRRELYEEAGITLNDYDCDPTLFGYYLIENDISPKWQTGTPYLQLRYLLKVRKDSKDITLSVNERKEDTDTLNEAKFVDLQRLADHISWIDEADEEYMEAKRRLYSDSSQIF